MRALVFVVTLLPTVALAQGLPLPQLDRRRPGKRIGSSGLKAHPDAPFQRALRAEAQRLARADTPGVELWTRVLRMAMNHYALRDDLTLQERFDRVMRDAGAVLVGERPVRRAIEGLRRVDRLPVFHVNGANDERADWLLRQFRVMDDVFAGPDLDVRVGSDFREGFHDGTQNQIYHSFFYVLVAYFTGNHYSTSLGNLVHELRDEGGSAADYDVGNWAAQLGEWLRRFRDQGNERAYFAIPTLVGAVFSNQGASYGRATDPGGRDFENVAGVVDDMVTEKLSNPTGGIVGEIKHRAHRGAIGVFNWVRGR